VQGGANARAKFRWKAWRAEEKLHWKDKKEGEMEQTRKKKTGKSNPEILIFDVDGVLVDVKETYWRSALETIEALTGKRRTWGEFYQWKRKPGNNDDWMLVSRWATSLGVRTSYEQARQAFQPFYWGRDGQPGNVEKEKLLVTPRLIERWAKRWELNLFTGRTRQEFAYTFERWPAARCFRRVVTMDDAKKKPDPQGLRLILEGRKPNAALYLGDNIDDALAAKAAGMPFIAILPKASYDYRLRSRKFRELGVIATLERAKDLEKWLE
jgi:HAD superfamily phosphatase